MREKECVVVIPIHKANPTAYELISFQQCFKILGNYTIKIVAPHGLLMDNYREVLPSFEILFIDPKWQANLNAYNRLKRSRYFYDLFDDFEFMLTYELDAFIFRRILVINLFQTCLNGLNIS
jgi:hypothetical protein